MITVIIDTREHEGKFDHITRYFDKVGVAWERAKLDFGDYTIKGYELDAVVERKCGLDELAGNFTKGRERFKREFERATENEASVCLMVERCHGIEDIMKHKYRSRFAPTAFYASIMSWCDKYPLHIHFVADRRCSGKVILNELKNMLEEKGIIIENN